MSRSPGELKRRLDALQEDFDRAGRRARQDAHGMVEHGEPPSGQLLEELVSARTNFQSLQADVCELATSLLGEDLSRRAKVASLPDLRALLDAIDEEVDRRIRAEATQAGALGVLDRVLALVHRDEPGSEALAKCLEQARALRAAIAAHPPPGAHPDVAALAGGKHAFTQLLTLVDERGNLTDARGAAMMTKLKRR